VAAVLKDVERTKTDPAPDSFFYGPAKLVRHVDDDFVARLTQLYRETLHEGDAVLDLMTAWESHLPEEVRRRRKRILVIIVVMIMMIWGGGGHR
jgi:hypothetical protein